MSLAGILVLGYDGAVMRRDVHLAMVAFWTSAPLFAVYLAVSWPQRHLPWPVEVLGSVVVVSSTYLTAWSFSPALREGGGQVRRTSEALAYPIALLLASYLLASQILFF